MKLDKSIAKKNQSTLESIIEELTDFGKKSLIIGAVAAMPFVYSILDPGHLARAQVFTYGVAAGKCTANLIQKKPVLADVIRESSIGAISSYPMAKTFEGLNHWETKLAPGYGAAPAKALKVGAWVFGAQPALTTGRTIGYYGSGKKFRENVLPSIKTTFKYLALPAAINVGFVYQYGIFVQMAVSAFLRFSFGLVQSLRGGEGSAKNLFSALNPVPYISGGLSIIAILTKNLLYSPLKAVYEIGSAVGDIKLPQSQVRLQ